MLYLRILNQLVDQVPKTQIYICQRLQFSTPPPPHNRQRFTRALFSGPKVVPAKFVYRGHRALLSARMQHACYEQMSPPARKTSFPPSATASSGSLVVLVRFEPPRQHAKGYVSLPVTGCREHLVYHSYFLRCWSRMQPCYSRTTSSIAQPVRHRCQSSPTLATSGIRKCARPGPNFSSAFALGTAPPPFSPASLS